MVNDIRSEKSLNFQNLVASDHQSIGEFIKADVYYIEVTENNLIDIDENIEKQLIEETNIPFNKPAENENRSDKSFYFQNFIESDPQTFDELIKDVTYIELNKNNDTNVEDGFEDKRDIYCHMYAQIDKSKKTSKPKIVNE